jgi:hypothetical protein
LPRHRARKASDPETETHNECTATRELGAWLQDGSCRYCHSCGAGVGFVRTERRVRSERQENFRRVWDDASPGDQGAIHLSNWLCEYWWAAVPLLVLAATGNFVLLKSHERRRWIVPGVWVASMFSLSLAVVTLVLFWASQGGVRLSNWICEQWWAVVPLLALAGAGCFALLKVYGHRRWVVPGLWIVSVSLFFSTFIALTLLSISVPMARLREALAT